SGIFVEDNGKPVVWEEVINLNDGKEKRFDGEFRKDIVTFFEGNGVLGLDRNPIKEGKSFIYGVVNKDMFDYMNEDREFKQKLDYDAIVPALIEEGYITEDLRVIRYRKLDNKFKDKFKTLTEGHFEAIEDTLFVDYRMTFVLDNVNQRTGHVFYQTETSDSLSGIAFQEERDAYDRLVRKYDGRMTDDGTFLIEHESVPDYNNGYAQYEAPASEDAYVISQGRRNEMKLTTSITRGINIKTDESPQGDGRVHVEINKPIQKLTWLEVKEYGRVIEKRGFYTDKETGETKLVYVTKLHYDGMPAKIGLATTSETFSMNEDGTLGEVIDWSRLLYADGSKIVDFDNVNMYKLYNDIKKVRYEGVKTFIKEDEHGRVYKEKVYYQEVRDPKGPVLEEHYYGRGTDDKPYLSLFRFYYTEEEKVIAHGEYGVGDVTVGVIYPGSHPEGLIFSVSNHIAIDDEGSIHYVVKFGEFYLPDGKENTYENMREDWENVLYEYIKKARREIIDNLGRSVVYMDGYPIDPATGFPPFDPKTGCDLADPKTITYMFHPIYGDYRFADESLAYLFDRQKHLCEDGEAVPPQSWDIKKYAIPSWVMRNIVGRFRELDNRMDSPYLDYRKITGLSREKDTGRAVMEVEIDNSQMGKEGLRKGSHDLVGGWTYGEGFEDVMWDIVKPVMNHKKITTYDTDNPIKGRPLYSRNESGDLVDKTDAFRITNFITEDGYLAALSEQRYTKKNSWLPFWEQEYRYMDSNTGEPARAPRDFSQNNPLKTDPKHDTVSLWGRTIHTDVFGGIVTALVFLVSVSFFGLILGIILLRKRDKKMKEEARPYHSQKLRELSFKRRIKDMFDPIRTQNGMVSDGAVDGNFPEQLPEFYKTVMEFVRRRRGLDLDNEDHSEYMLGNEDPILKALAAFAIIDSTTIRCTVGEERKDMSSVENEHVIDGSNEITERWNRYIGERAELIR
ncbi:MAG: hypothetical protein KAR32_14595, partial [Candidatus Omnitrophica bacterium]|nr:hypothetical protein [Candidatus Omnitrophota bacterium]